MFVAKEAVPGHTDCVKDTLLDFFEKSHLRERCDEEGYLGQRCGLRSYSQVTTS